MKAIVTVGVSASGKSTLARKLCREGYLAIDRDDLRFSLVKADDWSHWDFDNAYPLECMITDAHNFMIAHAAGQGRDIVIAETNLPRKTRTKWTKFLTGLGYEVEFVPLHISLEEAIDRDAKRQYSVGIEVIRDKQWPKWEAYLRELEVTNGI